MEKKQILVTGGMGYIGSHTAVELINEGYEVIIIDNLSNSRREVLDNIEKITRVRPVFEEFDLCDKDKLDLFFRKYTSIDAIIHFAAYKAVGESVEKPLMYYHNNLNSLINLISGMLKYNIPNFVFSSSCTVYGQPEKLPVTEEAPILPPSCPYANTKQICEEILFDSIEANPDISAIALRYFNPIGAHSSALIGELPLGIPNNLVPFLTQTAIGLREELKVFGGDYNTPDGSAIRDYIHVVDLAKAHVTASSRLINKNNKKGFEYFNLGTGRGSSVLEIINCFEKVSEQNLNYKIVDRRSGDIEQIWANTSYANKELGWKAESTLEETLLSAWNWEKNLKRKN